MAAEIEAIRGVAASDPGTNDAAHSPDTRMTFPGTLGRRPPAPETATSSASSEVGLVFEVDRQSHDLVIKIVDRDTKKVLREIPPEEVQRLRAAMQSILGTILDRTG